LGVICGPNSTASFLSEMSGFVKKSEPNFRVSPQVGLPFLHQIFAFLHQFFAFYTNFIPKHRFLNF